MVLTCSTSLSFSAFSTRVSASSCSSDCWGSVRRWAWWGRPGRRSSSRSGTGSATWGRTRGSGPQSWWACQQRWCSQSWNWGWPKEHDWEEKRKLIECLLLKVFWSLPRIRAGQLNVGKGNSFQVFTLLQVGINCVEVTIDILKWNKIEFQEPYGFCKKHSRAAWGHRRRSSSSCWGWPAVASPCSCSSLPGCWPCVWPPFWK